MNEFFIAKEGKKVFLTLQGVSHMLSEEEAEKLGAELLTHVIPPEHITTNHPIPASKIKNRDVNMTIQKRCNACKNEHLTWNDNPCKECKSFDKWEKR